MRKIKYSKDVDALLIELSDKQIDYAEEGHLFIHFSKDGEPVFPEILDAKDFILNSVSSVVKEKKEAKMRLKVDKENDALYFRLDESSIVESEEVQPGVVLDFNVEGKVVGIEILNLSVRMTPDQLKVFQYETA